MFLAQIVIVEPYYTNNVEFTNNVFDHNTQVIVGPYYTNNVEFTNNVFDHNTQVIVGPLLYK